MLTRRMKLDNPQKNPNERLPQDLSARIWRYMDLSEFVSLLDNRALPFIQAANLGDPFEGSISKPSLDSRPDMMKAIVEEVRLQNPEANPKLTPEWLEAQFQQLRTTAPYTTMISCWHIGDHESAAMWGLYCRVGDGVAIQSTIQKLAAVLPDTWNGSGMLLSEVSYVDYDTFAVPDGDAISPFFFKRASFAHEKELRALLMRPNQPSLVDLVEVDLDSLIEAVYIAPQSPDWYLSVVESLLAKYSLDVPLRKSRLDDPALH